MLLCCWCHLRVCSVCVFVYAERVTELQRAALSPFAGLEGGQTEQGREDGSEEQGSSRADDRCAAEAMRREQHLVRKEW